MNAADLKHADPRAERDTRVTAGRRREGGGRGASENHRQKSSQSLKATKNPASYVGLF